MTLIGQSSSETALTQLRQHASALLHLEDVLVLLLQSQQQQLVLAQSEGPVPSGSSKVEEHFDDWQGILRDDGLHLQPE